MAFDDLYRLSAHAVITDEQGREARYFPLDELSAVQRRRVDDCLAFDGDVQSGKF